MACELGIREHVVVSGNHWLSEDQVEQEKLSDPGDTEGEEIRSDDEGGSVDPTEVIRDSEMSRFSRGRDGKGDTHESHRPERHDLFHEMGAPGLPPGPSASQVVGRRNRHDVREEGAWYLGPEPEHAEDDRENGDGEHDVERRDEREADESPAGRGGVEIPSPLDHAQPRVRRHQG